MSLQKLVYVEHSKNIFLNSFSSRVSRFIRQISCWKCGNSADGLTCEKCNSLQDYGKYNYFEVLDMPVTFDVNNRILISKYHKLQTVFHPDKHSSKSDEEKKISASNSTIINKAYSVLLSPLERGFYILRINGHDTTVESPDRNFLILILKINDDISKMTGSRQYFKIAKLVQEEIVNLTAQIAETFKKKDLENAKKLLVQMRYYATAIKRAKERLQLLGISIE